MATNVTLVLKMTYETGRESGERQTSAKRVRFVRAHWFSLAGWADPGDFGQERLIMTEDPLATQRTADGFLEMMR